MINKVTLIGNLGKDPEVKHLENGASVARFSVATNENYKDKSGEWQTRTEWHIVVVWRALADQAERTLKKGSMVYVEGKLRSRNYQDSNGVEKSITEIEGYLIRSLDRRDRQDDSFPTAEDDPGSYNSNEMSTPKVIQQTPTSTPIQTTTAKPDLSDEEDDLPF